MSAIALYLAVALVAGAGAALCRLPPLLGYLVAGFVLAAVGAEPPSNLDDAADAGVALLLFAIGLKLDPRVIVRRQVWLTASVHLAGSVLLTAALLWVAASAGLSLLAGSSAGTLLLLGFALSFSSTVLVVKVLEDRNETKSFYGQVAIGILILQDIAAVLYLVMTGDGWPSPWALTLVLLPPAAFLVRRVWDRLGHGELQLLFGVAMAFVPGYALFDAVGLKGELGALAIGILLASHRRADELSKTIFGLKELLLVAFFLSIGLTGTLTAEAVIVGIVLAALLVPLKAIGFAALLYSQRLRHRTSLLGGAALANLSEFGLIVVSAAVEEGSLDSGWSVTVSVAVAASFVASSLLNRRGVELADRVAARLPDREPGELHPDDRPIDVGHAHAVVLGMGRVGRAAYDRLRDRHGVAVVGVDSDGRRVQEMVRQGRHVVEADATDADFWDRVARAHEVEVAILAMPFHGSNLEAMDRLRDSGFAGRVAVLAKWDDELEQARDRGATTALQLYDGAGGELADRAMAGDR